jgi:diaminohydroxyphosphoribosylaminopyrimidine deaminase/5-amino-6-(5-phosphoribosylamino)uracil reductase
VNKTYEKYMRRCLELARKGGKATQTNPWVGAVLVHQDRIIGEGYHMRYGGPHAEINCLASVKEADRPLIADSTIYVSLEPCCIHSKTPPCTSAILANEIKKVVISINDPNEKVDSISTALLKKAGVEVVSGVLSEEGYRVIAPFKAHLSKRPHIILKWAQSADGYIGKRGKQVWLSNKLSKIKSHQWRTEINGILVGYNTAVTDDPSLNARLVPGPDPLRIVLTDDMTELKTKQVWTDDRPTLFVGDIANQVHKNKECVHCSIVDGDLTGVLDLLFEKGVHHLLVEGGSKTLKKFVAADLWDVCRIIKTPTVLTSGIRAPQVKGKLWYTQKLESDVIEYLTPLNKC